MATQSGLVKRIVSDRGFGFIKSDNGDEYFFHRSALGRDVAFEDLREGQRVDFSVGQSAKGPRAEDVRVSP